MFDWPLIYKYCQTHLQLSRRISWPWSSPIFLVFRKTQPAHPISASWHLGSYNFEWKSGDGMIMIQGLSLSLQPGSRAPGFLEYSQSSFPNHRPIFFQSSRSWRKVSLNSFRLLAIWQEVLPNTARLRGKSCKLKLIFLEIEVSPHTSGFSLSCGEKGL